MLIATKNLSFTRDGRFILHGVEFELKPKEIVTLVGPNGGGKTTFIKLLLGLLTPSRGEVIRAKNLTIGYVPQKLTLDHTMPLSVYGFLSLRHSLSRARALEVLERVGAAHIIGSSMATLSGGELQRAALARALLRKPDILVLDEPAQGLDYKGAAGFYSLIGDLRDELSCAVLMISHDLHVVMGKSDRVLCLNGHICCSGKPETVAGHPEYQNLFGPEAAEVYGLYTHSHNHEHDIGGDTCCESEHLDCDHTHGLKNEKEKADAS